MSIRMDKFKVGDKVTWANEDSATCTSGRAKYGSEFVITHVFDRPDESPMEGDELGITLWQSMGHTQHVSIDGNPNNQFSGAFFKLIEEQENVNA